MIKNSKHMPAQENSNQSREGKQLSNSLKPWDSNIYEVLLSAAPPDKSLCIPIEGGSDVGQFCIVGTNINPSRLVYHPILSSPKKSPSILRPGDAILEIGEYQISGFTRLDANKVCEILSSSESTKNRPRLLLKLIPASALPLNDVALGPFLSASFPVGSREFLLQEVTRDNVYQRVVPCTTRMPRPDEVNGVHYQFLRVDQFLALEKSGQLLESGTYKGNYYGTPRPDPTATALGHSHNTNGNGIPCNQTRLSVAGSSGSSRRSSGDSVPLPINRASSSTNPLPAPAPGNADEVNNCRIPSPAHHQHQHTNQPSPSGATHEETINGQPRLPPGWEVIDHPEFGLFYIDHIHKRTQYESPSADDFDPDPPPFLPQLPQPPLNATTSAVVRTPSIQSARSSTTSSSSVNSRLRPDVFTTDVSQLRGPLATAVLIKGVRGFGFTIIGGSSSTQPGFLQVKNLIADGPAAVEATLSIGDILVSANGVNLLGYSHDEIVSLFQSIPVGSPVNLVVSQGYSLSQSPRDHNKKLENKPVSAAREDIGKGGGVTETYRSTDRIPFAPPEFCIRRLNTSPTISQSSGEPVINNFHHTNQRPEFIKVNIVKQSNGFGFTLADQPQGQRVKEVLGSSRCDGLRVGDVLVEINDQRVKESTHLEIVQLLKTCPIGLVTRFLVQRGQYNAADLNPHSFGLNSNFVRIPSCESPDSIDDPSGKVSFLNLAGGPYPVFSRTNYNVMQSSMIASGCSRFRSRTPGPEDRRSLMSSALGNSSDCIYSLGDSFSGLDLVSPTSLYRPGVSVAADWPVPGLRRYGGNEFDAFGPQPGFPRNNLSMYGADSQNGVYGSLMRSSKLLPLRSSDQNGNKGRSVGALLPGEFLVRLRRQTGGFGFKLMGGAEEGTQVCIGSIVPGGAAEKSGIIQSGDHLVSVNGQRVVGKRHHQVFALLEQASAVTGEITLGLCRPNEILPKFRAMPASSIHTTSGSSSHSTEGGLSPPVPGAVRQVVLQRSPADDGYGFVIASSSFSTKNIKGDQSKPKGQYIARLVPGSPADQSHQLRVGDRLLSVNGVSITGLRHDDIVRIIRESGTQIVLNILPQSPIPTYENHQANSGPSSRPALLFEITLFRASRGFGFSIRGGHEFNQMPLTVLRIAEGGSANLDGRLKVGDELLQINGHFTAGMSHRRAVEIIQAGGQVIHLVVRRFASNHIIDPVSSTSPHFLATPHNLLYSSAQQTHRFPLPPVYNEAQYFFNQHTQHHKPLLSSEKLKVQRQDQVAYKSLPRPRRYRKSDVTDNWIAKGSNDFLDYHYQPSHIQL